jgi:S-adenosylmethionine synthetase
VTTTARVDIPAIVKRIAGDVEVRVQLSLQSPEIARGVNDGGAGDQGIMIGYACDENPELVPHEYYLARNLNQFLYATHPQDGKTQVTLQGNTITNIVASWANVPHEQLKKLIEEWGEAVSCELSAVHLHINPAGDWSVSGFDADSGLSGRKIVIDNYGPRVPVGGGSFSGKDATKVDRSAAYKARQVAVRLLKERDAHEVLVRVAYAIGEVYPIEVSAHIDGLYENLQHLREEFVPQHIIESLNLRSPQYEKTAEYGHMGRGFVWDTI